MGKQGEGGGLDSAGMDLFEASSICGKLIVASRFMSRSWGGGAENLDLDRLDGLGKSCKTSIVMMMLGQKR